MDARRKLREWIDIVENKKMQLNESKLTEWSEGDKVAITGGDHEGKTGTVKKSDVRGPNALVTIGGNDEYVPTKYLKKSNNIKEQSLSEVTPKGWEKTVRKMKKHKDDIEEPYALAHWMKKKGYKPSESYYPERVVGSWLVEVAPPGEKAERFVRKAKADFQDRYGDRWEEVLYATAWDLFGDKTSESLEEKWKGDVEVKKLDKWGKYTVSELKKKADALRAKKDRTDAETKRLRQINFAIRAKRGWKGGKGAAK